MRKKLLAMCAAVSMIIMSISGTVVAAPEGVEVKAQASYVAGDKAPVLDGAIDDVWETTEAVYTDYCHVEGVGQAYGYSKILWSEDALYFLSVIEDATLEGIGDDSTTNIVNLWVSETGSDKTLFGEVAGDYHYAANAAGNTYYYVGNDMSEIAECVASTTEEGYIVEVKVPVQTPDHVFAEGQVMGFNISVDDDLDGDNVRDAFCSWQNYEETGYYWEDPSCLHKVELVESAAPKVVEIKAHAAYASEVPAVDAAIEDVWETTEAVYTDYCHVEGVGQAYGYSKILWTEDALYFLSVLEDATLEGIGDDSTTNIVNLWVSETGSDKTLFGEVAGDYHYAANAAGNTYYYVGNDMSEIAECAATVTEEGYIVEVKVPIQTPDYAFAEGQLMGFNISIDDDLDGDNVRDAFCSWQNYEETGYYWEDPSCLHKVELVKTYLTADDGEEPAVDEEPVVDEEPTGNNIGLYIGVGVVIVAVAGVLVVRKKK